jgi:hypothetical protein
MKRSEPVAAHRTARHNRRTSTKRIKIVNTKIIIAATVAALSLATTAFAGEGGRSPAFTGAGLNSGLPTATFDNTVLPQNGQNGSVETANSLPRGAMDGTVQVLQAQSVDRWYAQQADHRFAQQHKARLTHTNG